MPRAVRVRETEAAILRGVASWGEVMPATPRKVMRTTCGVGWGGGVGLDLGGDFGFMEMMKEETIKMMEETLNEKDGLTYLWKRIGIGDIVMIYLSHILIIPLIFISRVSLLNQARLNLLFVILARGTHYLSPGRR
jgi:hypothetical protein